MNKIEIVLKDVRKGEKKLLIPYFMAGHPNMEATIELIENAEAAGADMIEIGVPFSDPMADGPVIQNAGLHSLEKGTTLKKILNLIASIRDRIEIPIILMTYYNPVYFMGKVKFVQEAVKAGVDGIIVPDLPVGQDEEFNRACLKHNLHFIPLVAPTTSPDRMKYISDKCQGFVYCISSTGTTGIRDNMDESLQDFLKLVRKYIEVPLVVGFGISNEKIAKAVALDCDGVVVGSALVDTVEQYSSNNIVMQDKVNKKISGIKRAISEVIK